MVTLTRDAEIAKTGEIPVVSAARLRGGGTYCWVDLPQADSLFGAPTAVMWTADGETLIGLVGPKRDLARQLVKVRRRASLDLRLLATLRLF